MILELISFGFSRNNLPEVNYLFDVRFLNNPFYVDKLRPLTGLDNEVIDFFENDKLTTTFLKELSIWIEYIIELNERADKEKITVGIGCTGGQHRSPYIVESLAKALAKKKSIDELSVYHKELNKYNARVTP